MSVCVCVRACKQKSMFTVGMCDCAGGGEKKDRAGTPCCSKAAAAGLVPLRSPQSDQDELY